MAKVGIMFQNNLRMELLNCILIITLIREAGKDHTQNPRETAVMRRALMAPNRCEKAKAMV